MGAVGLIAVAIMIYLMTYKKVDVAAKKMG